MADYVRAAVIGHPVTHSKSPLIHNYWIEKYKRSGSYETVDIPCENLKQGIAGLIEKKFAGFNVTLPHKEHIIEFCDSIDDMASAVSAVNTVIIENGKLRGTNTDVFGFIENIRQNAPKFDFTAGAAMVLGAGGAARAAVQGLLQEGVPEIRLFNRTPDKAKKLAENFGNISQIRFYPWEERSNYLDDIHLLVNTTSLGMEGQKPLEMDLQPLNPNALVNDIVYAPLMTNLLSTAKSQGNPVVTGIGMLLHQARPAFKQWFGVMPEVDEALLKKVAA